MSKVVKEHEIVTLYDQYLTEWNDYDPLTSCRSDPTFEGFIDWLRKNPKEVL